MAICDHAGRARWHDIWDGNPILAKPSDVSAGERVKRLLNGPKSRPYFIPPFTKDSGWTFNRAFRCRDHLAKIYLTMHEERVGLNVRAELGPYVLIEPFTKHENFRWSLDRWQAVAEACPDLTFVQHVHRENQMLSVRAAHLVPANFREACGLAKHCEVYVRSESGMCHAAAAMGARQVTLFGGCMDPEVMGYYPGQTVLADDGPGSPCGRWLPCGHCAAAMERITVEMVVDALRASLQARRAA